GAAPPPPGPLRPAPAATPVSQNSTACEPPRMERDSDCVRPARSGRRFQGRPRSNTAPGTQGAPAAILPAVGALLKGLPRKEVIQPQLPLRLPCYDFTPVASPTFDGSLPKGLGHRLRVLLTPVV